MCGIVAVTSKTGAAVGTLLDGLMILQNRGYDSAGIATVDVAGGLVVTKHASVSSTSDSIELLKASAPARHEGHRCGIAHTRWATHGARTDANAHPFMDNKGRIALVHNGTIENCDVLRAELVARGATFASQTDSEVIANLIGAAMDDGASAADAVKAAIARLEGTWGLVIISKDAPEQLIVARNGSPLVVGLGDGAVFVASEVTAFVNHTTRFVPLADGEFVVLGPDADASTLDKSRVLVAHREEVAASPAPHAHWTVKEILEQPAALQRTLALGSRISAEGVVKLGGLERNAESLLSAQHLVVAACGTSYFAAQFGARVMRSLRAFDTVQVEDAAEVVAETFPRRGGAVAVVSQSGETKDTHRALTLGQSRGLPAFSVVNQVGSLIARTTECGIYLNAGREHAVASTKAFTTQVAALTLAAIWFSQQRAGQADADAESTAADEDTRALVEARRAVIDALQTLPAASEACLAANAARAKALAARLVGATSMFVLGKGLAEPIAKEAALKIKEITYVHAEGFSGGALKHGPFALLEEGTPVVLVVLDDAHCELMKVAAQEVKARGTFNIIVTDRPEQFEGSGIADEVLAVPRAGPLTALLAVLPLQQLAYELALARGINPDKPKNLAKAVTVD